MEILTINTSQLSEVISITRIPFNLILLVDFALKQIDWNENTIVRLQVRYFETNFLRNKINII